MAEVLRQRAGVTERRATTWPFMAAPEHHDSQVDAQHGVGVPNRQEVQFADGNCIWLRRVIVKGVPDLFLRDLGDPLEGTRIDLRDHLPDVEKELPQTCTRDVVGYVKFSLRLKYPTLQAFVDVVKPGAKVE
jgi:hypothetical protein